MEAPSPATAAQQPPANPPPDPAALPARAEELTLAVADGDLETVQELLEITGVRAAAAAIARGAGGRRRRPGLLHIAATNGRVAVARELLAEGSPGVDEREAAQGQTALHIAAEWSNVEFMRLLREHSAAIDEADALGLTPLLAGAANGVLEPLRLLAQWGADLAATEPSRGRSATHLVR